MLHETASHDVGKFAFLGADTVRSRSGGQIVGYDSITGRFYPKRNKFVVQVALALKGGIIVGRVSGKGDANQFDGRILKGSGKYSGVEGTITGRFPSDSGSKVFLTLHYHF